MSNEAARVVETDSVPRPEGPRRVMKRRLGLEALTVTFGVAVLGGVEARQGPTDPGGEAAGCSATLRVCLAVSVQTTHPRVDVRTMKDETARIWQSNGVEVVYATARDGTCTVTTHGAAMLVLVDSPSDLPRRLTGRVTSRALGSTVNTHGVPSALVLAFAERAVAAVSRVLRCSAAQPACVSRLLGRVVAHELGHVLLRTSEHSGEGLMRPVFGLDDALAAPSDAYMLATDDRDRVARHLRERRRCLGES